MARRRRGSTVEGSEAPREDAGADTSSEASERSRARAEARQDSGGGPGNMIPARARRIGAESVLVRVIATLGIVGIGVALAAILVGQDVEGWIVGLAVSIVTVLLAAVLWSSKQI
jgi:hypothetical protein